MDGRNSLRRHTRGWPEYLSHHENRLKLIRCVRTKVLGSGPRMTNKEKILHRRAPGLMLVGSSPATTRQTAADPSNVSSVGMLSAAVTLDLWRWRVAGRTVANAANHDQNKLVRDE